MAVPTYDKLFNPLLDALHQLGSSASIGELEEKVAENLNLSEKDIDELHDTNRTKFNYNLAWTRTFLKKAGFIDNSTKGVWSLTASGSKTKNVNRIEVVRFVRSLDKKESTIDEEVLEGKEPEDSDQLWQEVLLNELQNISPDAFERLCQRFLRESGFIQVEVTGRSGDGGVDGKGIFRVGGVMSFQVIFQCKRYTGNVSAQQVRDFRGATVGRADRGIVITTGGFTRGAKKEAIRDGAPIIDLIDGEQLVEKMKDLGLGVNVKKEEVVEINKEWFENFN